MVPGTLASARRGGSDLTETAGGLTASGRRYNPLDGGDAAFTTRNIAQKLTDPDAVNYVHATISSNRAIGIGAEIKIEGVNRRVAFHTSVFSPIMALRRDHPCLLR
jgi:hypothetical protein